MSRQLQLLSHLPGCLYSSQTVTTVTNASTRLLPILTAVLEEEGGDPWLNHLQVRIEHWGILCNDDSHSGKPLPSAPGGQCVRDLLFSAEFPNGGGGMDHLLVSSRHIVLDINHVSGFNLTCSSFISLANIKLYLGTPVPTILCLPKYICINPGLFAVMQCLNSESKTILEKRGKAGPDPAVRPAGLVRFVPKMLPQYFPGKFLICRYCREAECPSSLPFTRGSSRGRPPL